MRKLSDLIVDKSKLVLIIFVLLTICCAWLMTRTDINTDMTKYLPDDSSAKIGAGIMIDEFPAASSFNLMFKGLREDEKVEIYSSLAEAENVQNVFYEAESARYNKNEYTLYVVNLSLAAGSKEAKAAVDKVTERYSSYDIYINGDAAGNTVMKILPKLVGFALVILLIILFLMCNSWLEPFLFLITIAMAIVINMGTNIIFDSVSEITYSIAAVLQLCLSMDYSIMLINRYRQEKPVSENKNEAMKRALRNAFVSVSSSSVTTIVGMLSLVFMSFTIGKDMGFVLAKGVFFSLICIYTVLPALILLFDKQIGKTSKKSLHIKMDKIASFSYRFRYVIAVVFLVLFAGSFFLKGNVGITYTLSDYYKINEVFTPNNPIIILYENTDEAEVSVLTEKWHDNSFADSIDAYSASLGRELSYEELADAIGMDSILAAQMYYYYFSEKSEPAEKRIALGDFIEFLRKDVASNKQFSAFFTEDAMLQLGAMISEANSELMGLELTRKELSELMNIDEAITGQLFSYYAIVNGEMPQGKITIYDFIQFISEEAAGNEQFKQLLTADMAMQLETAMADMVSGKKQLVGDTFSRIIINTSLKEESEETFNFIGSLKQELDDSLTGDHYIIGSSAMAYEMHKSFPNEMSLITILTVISIFLVVAIALRSFSIPLILVCIIQCAVFITMGLAYIQGSSIYYLPLLIVQCLLLGATVDYGILYTSYYLESRRAMGIKEAIAMALNNSIHTILTSGLILIMITGVLGIMLVNSDQAISEILMTIAKGGACAVVLVVFILPGLMSALDKLVVKMRK